MSAPPPDALVLWSHRDQITTLTMNQPRRLNGWTLDLIAALQAAMARAAADPETQAVVLTGTDPYYSAGVNLGGSLELGHPRALRAAIVAHNQALFDTFLDFPKPILAAVNGPAIGATVTSATLCDEILASERATFSTPFAALSVPPEGCSSVIFPQRLGADAAARMLGAEGWQPGAEEALAVGLVHAVVPHEQLLDAAQARARAWVTAGRTRTLPCGRSHAELAAVNATESQAVADAFLSAPFLRAQWRFLWGKGKRGPALTFLALWLLRPLWARLL